MSATATKKKGEESVSAAADPSAPIGRSRTTPVNRTKEIADTRNLQIGQDHEARIALEGPAAIDVDDIETAVPGPGFKDHAEELKFNEDMLKIMISPDNSEFPEDPVQVGVNGRMCYIPRGVEVLVRRKYVERLCRAKPNNIRQDLQNFAQQRDEAQANKLKITASQRYPFSLLEDPDKKRGGLPWLRKLLAEA